MDKRSVRRTVLSPPLLKTVQRPPHVQNLALVPGGIKKILNGNGKFGFNIVNAHNANKPTFGAERWTYNYSTIHYRVQTRHASV